MQMASRTWYLLAIADGGRAAIAFCAVIRPSALVRRSGGDRDGLCRHGSALFKGNRNLPAETRCREP